MKSLLLSSLIFAGLGVLTAPVAHAQLERVADRVVVGGDATLAAGGDADSVVAVFGSASSAGTAREVVAVGGNATATGVVERDVVAVFGDVKVDAEVGHDVVAVMGSVELGPNAKVGHDVVVIGGTLNRDPAATIGHGTNIVSVGGGLGAMEGLRVWIRKCLFLGRPLALDKDLGWAWGVAIAFLLGYALLALIFRTGMERCVQTLQTRPGASALTALLGMLLTPVAMLVLVITVVGTLLVPVLGIALVAAVLFGKAAVLAFVGARLAAPLMDRDNSEGRTLHPAFAVLIGGVLMLALYLVPFLGGLLYKLSDILGFGVVLLTILTAVRAARELRRPPAAATVAAAPAVAASISASTAESAAAPGATAAAGSPAAPAQTAPAAHAGMERATFWQRMGALALDAVLVGVVLHLIGGSGGHLLLALAIYGCVMWVLKGTTIGGSVLGLQVVRLDGKAIDWGTGIVRALGCFLSLVVVFLGFIWIAIDPEKQAWHDRIAGTVVVRKPGGSALA